MQAAEQLLPFQHNGGETTGTLGDKMKYPSQPFPALDCNLTSK
jgi:hypothetical protein